VDKNCPSCHYNPGAPSREWVVRLKKHLISGNLLGARKDGRYRGQLRYYQKKLAAPDVPRADNVVRQVVVTREYRKRRRKYDYDNLVWGCKPILDVMTELGYIVDDSPTWVTRGYFQESSETMVDWVTIRIQEFDGC